MLRFLGTIAFMFTFFGLIALTLQIDPVNLIQADGHDYSLPPETPSPSDCCYDALPPPNGSYAPPPDGGHYFDGPPPTGGNYFDANAAAFYDPATGGFVDHLGGEFFDVRGAQFFDPDQGAFFEAGAIQFIEPVSGDYIDFTSQGFQDDGYKFEFHLDEAIVAYDQANHLMAEEFYQLGGDFSFKLASQLDQRDYHDLVGEAVCEMYAAMGTDQAFEMDGKCWRVCLAPWTNAIFRVSTSSKYSTPPKSCPASISNTWTATAPTARSETWNLTGPWSLREISWPACSAL